MPLGRIWPVLSGYEPLGEPALYRPPLHTSGPNGMEWRRRVRRQTTAPPLRWKGNQNPSSKKQASSNTEASSGSTPSSSRATEYLGRASRRAHSHGVRGHPARRLLQGVVPCFHPRVNGGRLPGVLHLAHGMGSAALRRYSGQGHCVTQHVQVMHPPVMIGGMRSAKTGQPGGNTRR